MDNKEQVWLSWSSGKDSAWTYYILSKTLKPTALFTTINEKYSRAAMHGTRKSILKAQAEQLGVELKLIPIPDACDNKTYEKVMYDFINQAKLEHVNTFAFGDLFLEDIRKYRVNQLAKENMNAVFPLWGKNTFDIAHEVINNGLKAIISCVDTQQIPKEFLGRKFDQDLLKDLPSSVDPCGENGEFHTCVYDSPNFLSALNLKTGETKESGQFCFIDLNFN